MFVLPLFLFITVHYFKRAWRAFQREDFIEFSTPQLSESQTYL